MYGSVPRTNYHDMQPPIVLNHTNNSNETLLHDTNTSFGPFVTTADNSGLETFFFLICGNVFWPRVFESTCKEVWWNIRLLWRILMIK